MNPPKKPDFSPKYRPNRDRVLAACLGYRLRMALQGVCLLVTLSHAGDGIATLGTDVQEQEIGG